MDVSPYPASHTTAGPTGLLYRPQDNQWWELTQRYLDLSPPWINIMPDLTSPPRPHFAWHRKPTLHPLCFETHHSQPPWSVLVPAMRGPISLLLALTNRHLQRMGQAVSPPLPLPSWDSAHHRAHPIRVSCTTPLPPPHIIMAPHTFKHRLHGSLLQSYILQLDFTTQAPPTEVPWL